MVDKPLSLFPRPSRLAPVLLALAVAVSGCLGGDEQSSDSEAPSKRPNLIVVMTDDQTLSAFNRDVMPFTHSFFRARGTVFEQAISAPPLCCPARAGFLSGQYPHNNGVFANTPGYPDLDQPGNTLPVWLQRAGYRTGFVGKYLNGYELVGGTQPAPGWDRWFQIQGYADYFGFEVSEDGQPGSIPATPGNYATARLTREAIGFARESARRDQPYFLWLAFNAPHTVTGGYPPPCSGVSAQPPSAQAYEQFAGSALPESPSFDEGDVSDKGRWVRSRDELAPGARARLLARWRCALAATRAVDEGVEQLVGALRSQGTLDETAILFVSDNGYFFGEHRIEDDKRLPYEPALRVPLALSLPAGSVADPPGVVRDLVSTVDLGPTLLDLAGAQPCAGPDRCRRLDGRSLMPLLEDGSETAWPTDRAILLELDDGFTYEALRTQRYLYLELAGDRQGPIPGGEIELYDLARDPDQLHNLWRERRSSVEPLQAELAARLDRLLNCRGSSADDFAIPPPSACE